MTGKERILKSINHEEPDRVPYDLSGTTVTAITRNAYQKAMAFKGWSTDFNPEVVDPIQQIITPAEENLLKLKSDTRRIGATRILQYEKNKIVEGTQFPFTISMVANGSFIRIPTFISTL